MRVIDIQTAQVTKTSIKQADSFDQVEQITREAVDYLFDLPTKGRTKRAPGGDTLHVLLDYAAEAKIDVRDAAVSPGFLG